MNMQFEHEPNDDRTDPRDGSRPWGRLTAKTNAGTSVIEVTLWPDGAHVLNIPGRRTHLGAVVTAAQLADLARMVESTAEWCAGHDELVAVLRAAGDLPRRPLAAPDAVTGCEA